MSKTPWFSAPFAPLGALLAVVVMAAPSADLHAQSSSPDFLFSPPTLNVTIRGGLMDYQATGQLFDFTSERFTTDASDFQGRTLGIELGVRLSEHFEATLGLDGGQVTVQHESRDWEEVDGSPIRQTTRVRSGPSGQFGIKGYVLPQGEQIGQFAWIPNRANVFVSGGIGVTAYEFRQFGDFVDEQPDPALIFSDDFQSEGAAFLMYAGAGGEVTLRRNLALVLEGRYQWSEDELSGDFGDFEPINLNGLRLTAGLSVRF
ncbi:MAG: hypothetical protein EA351_10755 [Gemmatimonadales bacterium]|nr:MAG: hypothetical protein EA351_10755 [Gemmatimonadales bacterium]